MILHSLLPSEMDHLFICFPQNLSFPRHLDYLLTAAASVLRTVLGTQEVHFLNGFRYLQPPSLRLCYFFGLACPCLPLLLHHQVLIPIVRQAQNPLSNKVFPSPSRNDNSCFLCPCSKATYFKMTLLFVNEKSCLER